MHYYNCLLSSHLGQVYLVYWVILDTEYCMQCNDWVLADTSLRDGEERLTGGQSRVDTQHP